MSVTVDQVRNYLRYDRSDEDVALGIMLGAAKNWVERSTGILLTEREVTQHVTLRACVSLQFAPYKDGTLAAEYYDRGLTSQALTDFEVLPSGRVIPASEWPASTGATFIYTAGYANPDDVPESLIHAVIVYCSLSDADRGEISAAGWMTLRNVLGDYWRPVIA